MAILKRLYKTKATKRHKEYQKYHKAEKKAGRKPLTFKQWSTGKEPVYFIGKKKVTPEARIAQTVTEIRKAREAARAKSRRSRGK